MDSAIVDRPHLCEQCEHSWRDRGHVWIMTHRPGPMAVPQVPQQRRQQLPRVARAEEGLPRRDIKQLADLWEAGSVPD